ncbi:MAG: hypothetical protein K8R18_00940 [Parvibaculum sp.]|uniref:hypothetical protein n=1 Tax=Parvibaculum sp. TaxID=2024848 RepID=UPI0025ED9EF7|nr:hypothetical protein [Parvibaculum sp.]MCE9648163.1 hypothetical protein [Parvibaculum sp.]
MFEHIVIRRCSIDHEAIDPGLVAETLLFYDKVHMLFDNSSLISALKTIGIDNLISLLERRAISASYLQTSFGTYTRTENFITTHKFVGMSLARHADGRKAKKEDMVLRAFDNTLGKSRATTKAANRLLSHLSFKLGDPAGRVTKPATEDLRDSKYVRAAVESTLRNCVPTYSLPTNWIFEPIETDSGIVIFTSLNFDEINAEYHKRIPDTQRVITSAWILAQILDARGDMCFAAEYMAEMVTDPIRSELISAKFETLLRRRLQSEGEIQIFQNTYLSNARAIREAINIGDRTFEEFLGLLDKADKFKSWLKGSNPDETLLREYIEATTRDTLFDKLPNKLTRFMIFTALGLGIETAVPSGIGISTSVGISALDTFLLDKLLKGWRPSQFVEGPLKSFTQN